MDARAYLRTLMESLVNSFNAGGQPDLSAIRSQLEGAARALVVTGDLLPDEARGLARLQWEAHDDLGGVYRHAGGGAGGGGTGGLTGQVDFAGPVAAGTRQFVVRMHHLDRGPMSVLIDLPEE